MLLYTSTNQWFYVSLTKFSSARLLFNVYPDIVSSSATPSMIIRTSSHRKGKCCCFSALVSEKYVVILALYGSGALHAALTLMNKLMPSSFVGHMRVTCSRLVPTHVASLSWWIIWRKLVLSAFASRHQPSVESFEVTVAKKIIEHNLPWSFVWSTSRDRDFRLLRTIHHLHYIHVRKTSETNVRRDIVRWKMPKCYVVIFLWTKTLVHIDYWPERVPRDSITHDGETTPYTMKIMMIGPPEWQYPVWIGEITLSPVFVFFMSRPWHVRSARRKYVPSDEATIHRFLVVLCPDTWFNLHFCR